MSTLQARLEEVMTHMGWVRADLVRITGQSSSLVSQWLGNGGRPIQTIGKTEAAEALERESGYAALWIARGIGPKKVPSMPSQTQQVREESVSYAEDQTYVLKVVEQLASVLEDVPADQVNTVKDALIALAVAPDSRRAKEAVVRAVTDARSLSRKQISTAA